MTIETYFDHQIQLLQEQGFTQKNKGKLIWQRGELVVEVVTSLYDRTEVEQILFWRMPTRSSKFTWEPGDVEIVTPYYGILNNGKLTHKGFSYEEVCSYMQCDAVPGDTIVRKHKGRWYRYDNGEPINVKA